MGHLFDAVKHIFLERFLDTYNSQGRSFVASCWKVAGHSNDRIQDIQDCLIKDWKKNVCLQQVMTETKNQ